MAAIWPTEAARFGTEVLGIPGDGHLLPGTPRAWLGRLQVLALLGLLAATVGQLPAPTLANRQDFADALDPSACGEIEKLFRPLRSQLPDVERLGYLTDIENLAFYYKAQSVLAPVLLIPTQGVPGLLDPPDSVRALSPRFVLGVFRKPESLESATGALSLELERELGHGIYLLRRVD